MKNFTNIKTKKVKKIINEYQYDENKRIDNILNQLESFGYNKKYVKECIENNVLCHATTAYFLMQNYDKI